MRCGLFVAFCLALVAASAQGQDARSNARRDTIGPETITPSMVSPTPEMWLYLQERDRHDDPQQAVRRKAEFRSVQRQARLASQRWYGFTNSRPPAGVTPWMGTYGPTWISNSADPLRWRGAAQPAYVVTRPGVVLY